MTRPNKQGLDYFPKWNPQRITENKFSFGFKIRYKYLRNSSSGFIKKKTVKDIIMKACNYCCAVCGNTNDLQIDHIISVYQVAIKAHPIEKLNTKENLQALCKPCNSRKNP